jgi:hypothetical protein
LEENIKYQELNGVNATEYLGKSKDHVPRNGSSMGFRQIKWMDQYEESIT